MEDWTCEDVPDGGPAEWADVTQACMPPVIAGVIDGRINVVGDGATTENDSQTGGLGEVEEDDLDDPRDVDDDSAEPELMPLGTQGGSEGSAGCVIAPGAERGVWSWAFVAFAALVISSRRRWSR
jgi:hypothetical protein